MSVSNRLIGIIGELSSLATELDPHVTEPVRDNNVRADAALARIDVEILSHRRRRGLFDEALGPLSSPIWLMLLELSAASLRKQRLAVSDVCRASEVSMTTSHRYVGLLEQYNLVQRRPDPDDRRRCWIQITPAALDVMVGWAETAPTRDRLTVPTSSADGRQP